MKAWCWMMAWVGVGFLMSACYHVGAVDPDGDSDEAAAECVQGATQTCICIDTLQNGAQICANDGTHWTACQCDSDSETDSVTDTEMATVDTDTDTYTNTEDTDTVDTDTDTGKDTEDTDTVDTDTDTGTDTEDTDTNTDTYTKCSGTGVWYDETTGLCWQNPPSEVAMNWSTAVSYCDNLNHDGHTDWRLPNIDELISLIRSCQDGTETNDMSPSLCEMTPWGCAATDSCNGSRFCDYCTGRNGPGESGCYWDTALSGTCVWYWSSSTGGVYGEDSAWYVYFSNGAVDASAKYVKTSARCVRGGL